MKKVICLVACWLAVVNGGVIDWTQSGEDYALNLFKQYCTSGQTTKGVNGDIHWFCKTPKEQVIHEEYEHHSKIQAPQQSTKQVIFLQTPSKHVKHNVRVEGEAGVQHDTNIYVLPPKITHDVDIQGEIRTKSEAAKPKTLFLKNAPGGGGGGGGGGGRGGGGGGGRGGGGGGGRGGSSYSPSSYSSNSHDESPFSSLIPQSPSSYAPAPPSSPSYGGGSNRHHRKRSHRPRKTTTLAPAVEEDFVEPEDEYDV